MAEIKSPLKAIRAKCLDCTCGQVNEVKECPITDCPLYVFRSGRNPYHKLNLTEEQRKKLAENARRNFSTARDREEKNKGVR